MENSEETFANAEHPNLMVTEEMRSYIYDMAKWASFLAIVGFVCSGIMVISAFTISSAMNSNPELALVVDQWGSIGKVIFAIISLVFAFGIFYPSLLFFKYSARAKNGILYGDQPSLDEAFAKLKSLFKYWGVITIIFISIYILLIISTVMNGLAIQN